MFVLYDIQHLEGGFNSCFSLVSIQSSGTQQAILIMPGDDRLYQGISAAAMPEWGTYDSDTSYRYSAGP